MIRRAHLPRHPHPPTANTHQQTATHIMPAADDITKKAETAASDAAAAASDAAGGLADSIKNLRLGERFKGLVRAYNELDETGTPLRPYIRSARESLNGVASGAAAQWAAAKEGACAAVESVKPDLSWLGKEVGTVDEFARTHRELVVGGVGLAVAVPSLIGGTRRAVVNGVLAAGVTAGVFGFSEWWERRHQEEAGKK